MFTQLEQTTCEFLDIILQIKLIILAFSSYFGIFWMRSIQLR